MSATLEPEPLQPRGLALRDSAIDPAARSLAFDLWLTVAGRSYVKLQALTRSDTGREEFAGFPEGINLGTLRAWGSRDEWPKLAADRFRAFAPSILDSLADGAAIAADQAMAGLIAATEPDALDVSAAKVQTWRLAFEVVGMIGAAARGSSPIYDPLKPRVRAGDPRIEEVPVTRSLPVGEAMRLLGRLAELDGLIVDVLDSPTKPAEPLGDTLD